MRHHLDVGVERLDRLRARTRPSARRSAPVLWITWRCRLERSTTSSSTMPSVPTPAAARYSAAGEPSPPAPISSTFASSSFCWPSRPTSGIEQVARVALLLLGGQDPRPLERVAAVLPEREAAGHRGDVLVAEQLLQRVRGERRALAGRAVEDHALAAIRHDALDARLQVPARNVDGARDVALLALALLAHVDDHGRRRRASPF